MLLRVTKDECYKTHFKENKKKKKKLYEKLKHKL